MLLEDTLDVVGNWQKWRLQRNGSIVFQWTDQRIFDGNLPKIFGEERGIRMEAGLARSE